MPMKQKEKDNVDEKEVMNYNIKRCFINKEKL